MLYLSFDPASKNAPSARIDGTQTPTFIAKIFNLSAEQSGTVIQVGYSISDILAKAGYGLLILGIATARSDSEGYRAA
jgi:hypothetical protein